VKRLVLLFVQVSFWYPTESQICAAFVSAAAQPATR